ncbi:4'-phosphopantetheinyl transferase family protein [Bartonella sp. DGB2]|uniref:4'-phosphopantetheinyl transferase family protein n=1 Tax=Bartonella sp. DGB2 TaxID=3388426 RepID=UPI0039901802
MSPLPNLLSPYERERFMKFKTSAHQQEYLVGRTLLRTILSQLGPLAKQEWQFVRNAYGRPEIAAEQQWAIPGLNFNISHSDALIVLAIGYYVCIGIDVEAITRSVNVEELAYRCFTFTEASFICDATE